MAFHYQWAPTPGKSLVQVNSFAELLCNAGVLVPAADDCDAYLIQSLLHTGPGSAEDCYRHGAMHALITHLGCTKVINDKIIPA